MLVEIEGAVHDAETEDPLNVPTLPVTNKRMPKTSKKFGRGKTRGGDRKGARATRVPQVVTTEVIGSNPPSSSNTSVPKKKITKLQLSKQLTKSMNKRKQSEEKAERAQKKLAIATANCKTLAALAQERRKIIVATEQTCERLVNEARTTAEAAVQDCKLLVDEAIEMSTAKSDRIITLAHNTAEKMVASITAKSDRIIKLANKTTEKKIASIIHKADSIVEKSRLENERLQEECSKQAIAVTEGKQFILTMTCVHASKIDQLRGRHKSALRDTQARHAHHYNKQKQTMNNEMNRLREMLYGQNEMIDGCLNEMRDERRAKKIAAKTVDKLKSMTSAQLEKIKLWKGKYEELQLLKDAYVSQSNEMEEMKQKIDEYEAVKSDMTEEYEETILSMCPRHIEKARVKNLTNNYGHQEWKPYVDKLIIELLCDRVPPTCIQLAMVSISKGEGVLR